MWTGDHESRAADNYIERPNQTRDDRFEADWIPSHPLETLQVKENPEIVLEPWNIVGIPYYRVEELPKPTSHEDEDNRRVVMRAVRNIESGRCQSRPEDDPQNKEIVQDKIDVTQTRLYWQERERSTREQEESSKKPMTIDYRTDYMSDEGEKEENVIILKLEQSNGLFLKPNEPIILTPIVEKKSPKKNHAKEIKSQMFPGPKEGEEVEKDYPPDYEKSWKEEKKDFWEEGKEEEHEQKISTKVLKFEKIDPDDLDEITKSQIPRVKTDNICKICKKPVNVDKCSKCGTLKSEDSDFSALQKFNKLKQDKRLSIELDTQKIKEFLRRKESNKYQAMSLDPQRSRTNFFGNSGSYTLRCNLNPISKLTYNKKKFYLTPDPTQLGFFKKLNEPYVNYENFTAKKREFKRQKVTSSDRFGDYQKKSDTVMW